MAETLLNSQLDKWLKEDYAMFMAVQFGFLKDRSGQVVIWQPPNLPLISWFVCLIISLFMPHNHWRSAFELLGRSFLFVWAYLELRQGVNYFRKLLGLLVAVGLIINFFR